MPLGLFFSFLFSQEIFITTSRFTHSLHAYMGLHGEVVCSFYALRRL